MEPMAEGLRDSGWSVVNVDYPSQAGPVEVIAPMAVDTGLEQCRAAGALQIHFVTHSIGGILVRYSHYTAPIPDLGRVVMLAPPNQGSEVIDITRDWPTTELFAGEAGMQLGTGPNSIPKQLGPVDFELGVIAGTGSINFVMSAMLPDPNDGKVSVASTRVDGMDDFLIVARQINSRSAALQNKTNALQGFSTLTARVMGQMGQSHMDAFLVRERKPPAQFAYGFQSPQAAGPSLQYVLAPICHPVREIIRLSNHVFDKGHQQWGRGERKNPSRDD